MPDGLAGVFRVREFRVIWAAELLSVMGDQLARVALAVLVFARTGSATWSAATYALTFLPALFGGVLLSGLADRYPRRQVMIVSDVLRALLVAGMAVPELPLTLLCLLLVVVVLLGAPHTAAQGAVLPDVLPGERYEQGLAVRHITGQTAQLVGFASGGLLVAALGPGVALVANAVTFALSAVLLRRGMVARPAAASGCRGGDATGGPGGAVAAVGAIAADPARRALVLLAWLVGCYVVPEALAAPYAAQVGASTAAVGLLMAADPLGSVFGAWAFMRFVPLDARERMVGVLAVAAGLPLLCIALRPGIPITLALLAASGMLSTAYLLQTQASFVRATPGAGRGNAIGVAASGIIAAQGVAVLGGGLLAELWSPSVSIAASAAIGMLLALVGAVAWNRASAVQRPGPPPRLATVRSDG